MYKPCIRENTVLLLLRDNLMYEITLACWKDGFQSFTWTLQACCTELQKEDRWFFRISLNEYITCTLQVEQSSYHLLSWETTHCTNFCHIWRAEATSIKLLQTFCLTNNASFQISLLPIAQMFLSHFRSWKSGKKGRGRNFIPWACHILCNRMRGVLDSQLPLPGQAQTSGQAGAQTTGYLEGKVQTWSTDLLGNVWVHVPVFLQVPLPQPQSPSFSLIKTTSSSLWGWALWNFYLLHPQRKV